MKKESESDGYQTAASADPATGVSKHAGLVALEIEPQRELPEAPLVVIAAQGNAVQAAL